MIILWRPGSPGEGLPAQTLELALHVLAPPLTPNLWHLYASLLTCLPHLKHLTQGMRKSFKECVGALCCRPDCSGSVILQVKAERHFDGKATIEDLQYSTVKHIKEEHHEEEEIYPDPSQAGKKSQ